MLIIKIAIHHKNNLQICIQQVYKNVIYVCILNTKSEPKISKLGHDTKKRLEQHWTIELNEVYCIVLS
jgi:hypothetical protein